MSLPRGSLQVVADLGSAASARLRRRRRAFFWRIWLLLAAAPFSRGAEPVPAPPPLRADLTGALRWLELPDAPPFQSHLEAQLSSAGTWKLKLTALADGMKVVIEGELPSNTQTGTWKITHGEAELGVWWRIAASRLGAVTLPTDLAATGTVKLAGEGTWRDGIVSGAITATLTSGSLNSAAQSWSAREISLTANLDLDRNRATFRRLQFSASSAEVAGVALREIAIEIAGTDDGAWSIRAAHVNALGGRIALEPFQFKADAGKMDLDVALTQLELAQLSAFAPKALSAADGRVSGKITVHWSAQGGFTPGPGSLRVTPNEGATIRLANSPGFLSQRVPAKINVLPPSFGPLATWLSAENPAYASLQQIEEGKISLAVEKLEIELYPDGPAAPRSASVKVTASPAAGSAVKTVSFTITVVGPLDEVIKLGLDQRVGLSLGQGK